MICVHFNGAVEVEGIMEMLNFFPIFSSHLERKLFLWILLLFSNLFPFSSNFFSKPNERKSYLLLYFRSSFFFFFYLLCNQTGSYCNRQSYHRGKPESSCSLHRRTSTGGELWAPAEADAVKLTHLLSPLPACASTTCPNWCSTCAERIGSVMGPDWDPSSS